MFKTCFKHLKPIRRSCSMEAAKKKRLGIIGVPFSKGQSKGGVDQAPDLLRKAGLIDVLHQASKDSCEIRDYGNLNFQPDRSAEPCPFENVKNYKDFIGCNKALISKVQEILNENDQILTIGGDHAIGFGSVAGHLKHTKDLTLIWIDAHADINLNTTSNSGNVHGMPVSFLLKELRSHWKCANLENIAPNCLPAKQLVYIGLRDIDPYEAYILKELQIQMFAMDAVDKYGIAKIIEMALDGIDVKNKLHVSFDIDALDSRVAPSTGTAVHGGLTLREGISIMEALRDTNRVQGIDLVEVNPQIGSSSDIDLTVSAGLEILKTAYGYKRCGNFENFDSSLLKK